MSTPGGRGTATGTAPPVPDPTGPGASDVAADAAAQQRAAASRRALLDHTLLLGTTLLLITLGGIMVLSASSVRAFASSGSVFSVFLRQAAGLAIGIPLLFLAARVPVATWRRLAVPSLLVVVVLLLMVLVPGLGVSVDGAQRWIGLGPLQLQPSEPAKLALLLWGADVLIRKRRLLDDPRHLIFPLLPVVGVLGAMVMLQPDLGTTIVLLLVGIALLWYIEAPAWLFGSLAVVVTVAVSLLAWFEPYRRDRLTAFMDPFDDPLGKGYQSVQGIYAMSSGGWFGHGLGASREKWSGLLPNAHTDFVFAIMGEELGLLGTLTLVALFVVVAVAGLRVARRATDPFARLAAAVLTTMIVGQAGLNMCTVVGLAPITGIPLPFLSYGNTALITFCLAMGMLLSFARLEPGAPEALARRRRARARAMSRAPWVRSGAPRQGTTPQPRTPQPQEPERT